MNWTGPETDLSYIRKVVTPGLAGVGTNAPNRPRPDPLICFYIKTLMTPALTLDALMKLMRVAAEDGFDQNLVRCLIIISLFLPDIFGRAGFFRLSCLVGRIQLSAKATHHLLGEMPCGLWSLMLIPTFCHTLTTDIVSLTVS